jgi:preprotein translocase subunit SecE
VARNRKRANRRSTRPPRPPGGRPGAAAARENGRTDVGPDTPELEPDETVVADEAVEPGEASEVAAQGPAEPGDSGLAPIDLQTDALEPIDLDATNIEPIDFGLDTGRTPEVEIAAASERVDDDDTGSSSEPLDADAAADEEFGDDEDLDEFLEEHPEDAADTEDYENQEDVVADADSDYDEDGVDDATGEPVGAGVAVARTPSPRRRRPDKAARKDAEEESEAVSTHRARGPARLVHFVQGSWRELQRVQWPDRRQVMQATGVVVGFVIVAGAFLGVADYLSTKLVNFILG